MHKDIVFLGAALDPTLPLIQIALRDISFDNLHRQLVDVRIVKIDNMIRRAGNDIGHVAHALELREHRASNEIIPDATETRDSCPALHPTAPSVTPTITASAKWCCGS